MSHFAADFRPSFGFYHSLRYFPDSCTDNDSHSFVRDFAACSGCCGESSLLPLVLRCILSEHRRLLASLLLEIIFSRFRYNVVCAL